MKEKNVPKNYPPPKCFSGYALVHTQRHQAGIGSRDGQILHFTPTVCDTNNVHVQLLYFIIYSVGWCLMYG